MNKQTLKTAFLFIFCLLTGWGMGMITTRYMCCSSPPIYIYDTTEVIKDTVIKDTIFVPSPKYITRRVIDTVYVNHNLVSDCFVVEQRIYGDSTYNAWVSGINPSLDSIKIFSKQHIKETVRTITDVQYKKDNNRHIFVGAGIQVYDNVYVPTLNLALEKKNWLVGANAGISNDKTLIGLFVNYKIK